MSYPKLAVGSDKYYRNAFAEETEFARVRRGLALRRAERANGEKVTLRLVDVSQPFGNETSQPLSKAA